MHAPARVVVVWSKISIAERVPVTVAFAVAVRTTVWPGLGELAFDEVRCTRGWSAGGNVQVGAVGVARHYGRLLIATLNRQGAGIARLAAGQGVRPIQIERSRWAGRRRRRKRRLAELA